MKTQDRKSLALLTRRNIVVAAIAGAVAIAAGVVWFQPQKLFIDQTVNEAAPQVVDAETRTAELEGAFTSLAHDTKGTAIVKDGPDGSRVLRLEDFETSNGPDVVVYLSAGDEGSYAKDFVDLGALKGNVGNQNYAIPADIDLDRYDTVVIWCRRFTVAFGAAKLA